MWAKKNTVLLCRQRGLTASFIRQLTTNGNENSHRWLKDDDQVHSHARLVMSVAGIGRYEENRESNLDEITRKNTGRMKLEHVHHPILRVLSQLLTRTGADMHEREWHQSRHYRVEPLNTTVGNRTFRVVRTGERTVKDPLVPAPERTITETSNNTWACSCYTYTVNGVCCRHLLAHFGRVIEAHMLCQYWFKERANGTLDQCIDDKVPALKHDIAGAVQLVPPQDEFEGGHEWDGCDFDSDQDIGDETSIMETLTNTKKSQEDNRYARLTDMFREIAQLAKQDEDLTNELLYKQLPEILQKLTLDASTHPMRAEASVQSASMSLHASFPPKGKPTSKPAPMAMSSKSRAKRKRTTRTTIYPARGPASTESPANSQNMVNPPVGRSKGRPRSQPHIPNIHAGVSSYF